MAGKSKQTEAETAYWQTREGEDRREIGGWCPVESVPSYGEVGSESLPTQIETETRENGNFYAVSPPVFGSSRVYRYELFIPEGDRARFAGLSRYSLEQRLRVTSAEAPYPGSTRENWWWAKKGDFRTLRESDKTPVRLMKAWKRGMLEIMLDGHPERDAILTDWDDRVARHNAHVARPGKRNTPNAKKADGDLVVLPAGPVRFNGDQVHQIFRYTISSPTMAGRAKHSLVIGGVRYKTPHSSALTFKDGVVPDDRISAPVAAVLPLLMWAGSGSTTAHDALRAKTDFEPVADRTLHDLETFLATAPERATPLVDVPAIEAAISALTKFAPINPGTTAPGPQQQEFRTVQKRLHHLHDILVTGRTAIRSGATQDDP